MGGSTFFSHSSECFVLSFYDVVLHIFESLFGVFCSQFSFCGLHIFSVTHRSVLFQVFMMCGLHTFQSLFGVFCSQFSLCGLHFSVTLRSVLLSVFLVWRPFFFSRFSECFVLSFHGVVFTFFSHSSEGFVLGVIVTFSVFLWSVLVLTL